MDSDSNSSASARCSPIEPTRRLPIGSLLNSEDVSISFTPANGRKEDLPIDSPMKMDIEIDRSTPDGDDDDSWVADKSRTDDPESKHSRNLRAAKARLRKKQWTSQQIHELQKLYQMGLGWADIAERLGRSPDACKLKHNKELRRKAPSVMLLPGREPLRPSPPPYQVINSTIDTLREMSHEIRSRQVAVMHEVDAERASAVEHAAGSRGSDGKPVASISHLERMSLDSLEAFNRQQQSVSEAWSALVHLRDMISNPSRPHPVGVRPLL